MLRGWGGSASPTSRCVPPESAAGSQQKASGLETGPLRPRHRALLGGGPRPLYAPSPRAALGRHHPPSPTPTEPKKPLTSRERSRPAPRLAAPPRAPPEPAPPLPAPGGSCPAAELPLARPPQPIPAQGAGKEEHDKFGGNLRILLERKGLPYLEPGSPLLPLIKKKQRLWVEPKRDI